MLHFDDPPRMPGSGEAPAARFARGAALAGTPGAGYVEHRGVPVAVAAAAGLRYDAAFGGRPAVLAPLCDRAGALVAVHGRYLQVVRGQNKMLTVGVGGGALGVGGGWRAEPLILVEGLFDALSLATCGWDAVATIGRWTPWLPEVAAGRTAWLAFDAGRPGEAEVERYAQRLGAAAVRRLPPPPRCKDWNCALRKYGRAALARWLATRLGTAGARP